MRPELEGHRGQGGLQAEHHQAQRVELLNLPHIRSAQTVERHTGLLLGPKAHEPHLVHFRTDVQRPR